MKPTQTSAPSSRRPVTSALPGPGSVTSRNGAPVAASTTLTSDVAWRLWTTTRSPPARVASSRTASGSSATTWRQAAGPGSDAAASTTHRRPRGASRSVSNHSRPSRLRCGHAWASTPASTRRHAGAAATSLTQTSLRGAVPSERDATTHRPSSEVATP